jgi:phage baseplate assembly protein W
MDDIPHIALPIEFIGGTFATVQQDTTDEVAACVAAIVSFPIGYREDQPEFGITDPSFQTRPLDTTELEEVIETYEPRAELTVSESAYDRSDPLGAEIEIEVAVIAAED